MRKRTEFTNDPATCMCLTVDAGKEHFSMHHREAQCNSCGRWYRWNGSSGAYVPAYDLDSDNV